MSEKSHGAQTQSGSHFSLVDQSLLMLFMLNVGVSIEIESVNALFPLYVQSLGASILEVGFLLSAAGLFSTALMLPSGWLSDRFGKKPTLVLSVAIAELPAHALHVCYRLAPTYPLVYNLRGKLRCLHTCPYGLHR